MKKSIYIVLLVLIVSCDVFESRDPETPDTGRTNFIAATTPAILFQNLVSSLQEKVLENYMACFVDTAFLNRSFRFVPSAGSISQFGVLADWNLNSESQYFTNVRSNTTENSPIILNLSNEVNNIQSDSAFYQFDYVLSVPLIDEARDGNYQGSLQFTILLDSRKQWVITEWEDIKKKIRRVGVNLKDFIIKLIVYIFLIFGLYGCVNPFAPTLDNEFGEDGGIISDQTNIDGVFQNFQYAYTFKDTTIYGQLLNSNFTFVYRDYDLGVDISWGRDEEMKTTYGLFQNSQRLDLIWNNIVSITGDSTNVVRSFNLTITFNPTDIIIVDGRVNVDLLKNSDGRWQINRWIDESNF